jgi:hypothetical protein
MRHLICDDTGKSHPIHSIPFAGIIDPGGFADDKPTKNKSRNVMLIGGQPPDTTRKFIVYCHASRIKETQPLIDEWLAATEKWKPKVWYIEITGPGQYMKKDLERVSREKRLHVDIVACPAEMSQNAKADRITSLIRPFEQGEIYLLNSMVGLGDLKMEYVRYPNSLTKDILDAMGWLYKLWWCRRPLGDLSAKNKTNFTNLLSRKGVTF